MILNREQIDNYWRSPDLTVADLRDTARAYHDLRDAVLALHKPYRIYEECDCTPEQIEANDDAHVYALDIGMTCALMYVVCRECCCDGTDREYQTETCASYHEHTKDPESICATVRVVARVERGGS